MGLLRMAARTAVVAGTATAVSGRVQRRQAAKWDAQEQQQYAQEPQQYAPPPQYAQAPQQYAQPAQYAPPAPEAEDDATAQLQNLAKLHTQGVLTDEEFAAAKAKILGI
jgi:Short C-terminal domain